MRLPAYQAGILLVLTGLGSGEEEVVARSESSLWSGWALVTPILGDLSPDCVAASESYINNLNGAFQAVLSNRKLTASQENALRMFDANGAIPFFQEGILQDATAFDLCYFFPNSQSQCESLPASLRWLLLPGGARNGPGSPSVCREAAESKYCHNYYSPLPVHYCKLTTTSTSTTTTSNPSPTATPTSPRPDVADLSKLIPDFRLMDFLNNPHFGAELRINIADMSGMFGEEEEYQEKKYYSKLSLDPSTLIDPLDILLEKNSQARVVHSQLMEIFKNETLFPTTNGNPVFQAFGVMALLWEDI